MKRYEIEVYKKNPQIVLKDLEFIFPAKKIEVEFSKLYLIETDIEIDKIKKSINLLFCDPVVERYRIKSIKNNYHTGRKISSKKRADRWEIKVYYHPEVTDPAGETIIKALSDINVYVKSVVTGKRYILKSKNLKYSEVELITRRLLANYIVENAYISPQK